MYERITKKRFIEILKQSTSWLVYSKYTDLDLLREDNFNNIVLFSEQFNYDNPKGSRSVYKANDSKIEFVFNETGKIYTLDFTQNCDGREWYSYGNIVMMRTKHNDYKDHYSIYLTA
jgi:hypothetical protein